MGDPTKDKQIGITVRSPGGMLRRPSPLILPPYVAYLSENMRHKDELARRRKGAVVLGHYTAPNGSVTFDGTTATYVTFPDHTLYDLPTKWALLGDFTFDALPGTSATIAERDVGGGLKTFGMYLNADAKITIDMHDSAGTLTHLTGVTAQNTGIVVPYVLYRDGATLALHLNGNPTAEVTSTTVSGTLNNAPGATKIGLGVGSNDDYAANFGKPLSGKAGFFAIALGWSSIADLVKYSAGMKYANPRDPRFILAAYFSYSKETGAVAKDWSRVANHGTLVGSPSRTSIQGRTPAVVQYLAPFLKRSTGELQNIAFIGGDFIKNIVRKGTS